MVRMMTKAVAYIRVSSQAQDDLSPGKQIEEVQQWIKTEGWKRFAGDNNELYETSLELDSRTPVLDHESLPEITGFFYDVGSASDRKKISKRTGILALIRHCKKFHVKHIIFYTVSRLERGTTFYEREFLTRMERSADLQRFYIHICAQGERTVLRPLVDRAKNAELKTKLIEAEKRALEISMHSKAGKLNSYERGLFTGRPLHGYKAVRNEKGKVKEYIFTDQTPIVRRLFEMAKEPTNSVADIHQESIKLGLVNSAGKKKGKPFQKESVRLMLINKGYTGMVKHPDPEVGTWKKAKGIPALITMETWKKVQDNLSKRNVKAGMDEPKNETSWIAKLMKCRHCECRLALEPKTKTLKDGTQKTYRYIRCSNGHYYTEGKHQYYQKKFGTKLCIQTRTTEDKLIKAVDAEVMKLYMDEDISRYIVEELETTKSTALQEIETEIARLTKLQGQFEDTKTRILEGFDGGLYTLQEAKEKKAKVDQDIFNLDDELKALSQNKTGMLENTTKLLELAKSLKNNYLTLTPRKKAEMLNLMTLELEKEDDKLHITWAEPFNVLSKLGKTKGSKSTAGEEISKGVQSQHAQVAAGFRLPDRLELLPVFTGRDPVAPDRSPPGCYPVTQSRQPRSRGVVALRIDHGLYKIPWIHQAS